MRAHHPALADASDADIRAISAADARLVLAREHGFASWDAFRRHVEGLAESGEPFRRAFQAIEARDAHGARAPARPLSGTRHGARHERQRPARPGGDAPAAQDHAIVRELLARGADPSSANDRGWTPLHQAGYGNDAGSRACCWTRAPARDLYGHGEGGTPLAAALFWGTREVADLLAEREIVPRNLRIAAGLGRLDLIRGARARRTGA